MILKLKERDYVLYAPSDDERLLWVFVFNWIISENKRLAELKEDYQRAITTFKEMTVPQKAGILKKIIE